MTLSDTQLVILQSGARDPERLCRAERKLGQAPRQAIAKKLLAAGLVEIAGPWRTTHAPELRFGDNILRITDAGLRAIGVEEESPYGEDVPKDVRAGVDPFLIDGPDNNPPDEPQEDGPEYRNPTCDTVYDGPEPDACGLEASVPGTPSAPTALTGAAAVEGATTHAADDTTRPTATTAPTRGGLRAAAQAVLDAWDDEENQRYGLTEAIDALRAALAGTTRTRREPGAPRKPREGTKQEAVLALLRRDEGTTIAQIIDATGWQSHTVRGFLAGLKRKGITVEVVERVRQVGPNKEGAKGSYSVYRVAG